MLLVTGGYDEHINYLDTTELLRPGSGWQEISSARLPRPMYGVRLSTVDNRVLLFGELNVKSKQECRTIVKTKSSSEPKIDR